MELLAFILVFAVFAAIILWELHRIVDKAHVTTIAELKRQRQVLEDNLKPLTEPSVIRVLAAVQQSQGALTTELERLHAELAALQMPSVPVARSLSEPLTPPKSALTSSEQRRQSAGHGVAANSDEVDTAVVVDVVVFGPDLSQPEPNGRAANTRSRVLIVRTEVARQPGKTSGGSSSSAQQAVASSSGLDLVREVSLALDRKIGEGLTNAIWATNTRAWVADSSFSPTEVANTLADLKSDLHEGILGNPVTALTERLGLSDDQAVSAGTVAAKLALPGDGAFRAVRRTVQFAGMFVGVVTGQPHLAVASAHSFLRDEMRSALTSAVGEFLHPSKSPVELEERSHGDAGLNTSRDDAPHIDTNRRIGDQPTIDTRRLGSDSPDWRVPPPPPPTASRDDSPPDPAKRRDDHHRGWDDPRGMPGPGGL